MSAHAEGGHGGRSDGTLGGGASLAARIELAVRSFAAEVGSSGPVTVVGAGTHAAVLAPVSADAREVRAPSGVWEHEPSEMTVRCGAGTCVAELNEHLSASRQMVPLDPAEGRATVGGVLACGFSGHRRLRYGHVRDLVLQTRHVDAAGKIVTAGGPTVKNVSGYDLPRLLVGSLGTLGFLAEVILRTLPLPPASAWLTAEAHPFAAFDLLYRPSSVLWNGRRTWVLLEGDLADVEAESHKLAGSGFEPCDEGPPIPDGARESRTPAELRELAGTDGDWIAEVGVGLVHRAEPAASPNGAPRQTSVPSANLALMRALKDRLDPEGRLNPGHSAW